MADIWQMAFSIIMFLNDNICMFNSPFSGSGGATVASGNPRFQNEAICDNTSTTGVMGADSQWSSVSLGIYHDCVNRRHRLEIIIQDFSIAHTFYSHTFGWYFDAWLFWLQPVELPIGWWCHCGHALIWSQNGCQCIWCRQEGAFLFWVLSRRHYFTSPQNGIIPFFRHSRTSPVDGTFRLFWWIPVKHMVLRSWDVNFVCTAKVDQVAPKA